MPLQHNFGPCAVMSCLNNKSTNRDREEEASHTQSKGQMPSVIMLETEVGSGNKLDNQETYYQEGRNGTRREHFEIFLLGNGYETL